VRFQPGVESGSILRWEVREAVILADSHVQMVGQGYLVVNFKCILME
jgi:hypothetical protein